MTRNLVCTGRSTGLLIFMLVISIFGSNGFAASWNNTQDFPWTKQGYTPAVYHSSKIFILSADFGVWSSETGANWSCVQRNPGWAPRTEFMTASFQGKIWVMGGRNAASYFHDIWSSPDGVTWTKETDTATWGGRALATPFVYNSKLYLFGGYTTTSTDGYLDTTTYQFLGELWSSPDGTTWTSITVPWSGRAMPAVCYVPTGGDLCVIGGAAASGALTDIWTSHDGNAATWTQDVTAGPYGGDWSLSSLGIGADVYIYGGLTQKVLRTAAPNNWTELTPAPWPSTWAQTILAAGSKYYMIAGAQPDATATNLISKVYESTNGTTWSHVGGDGEMWSPRWLHRTVQFNNSLYLLGGMGDNVPTTGSGEVWRANTTGSGTTWEAVTKTAPWNRWGHGALNFNNKLWVLGGSDDTIAYGDAWSSSDGASWTLANGNAFPKRSFHAAAVFNNAMYVIGGVNKPEGTTGTATVYSSTDGSTWNKVTDPAPFAAREGMAAVVFNNKLWVIGGAYYDQNGKHYMAETWSTTNGSNWTKEASTLPFSRQDFGTAVYDGKIWVFGGSNLNTNYNDMWSSADGITWVSEGNAPWSARTGLSVAQVGNNMWLTGGCTNEALNDVWTLQTVINSARRAWTQLK